MSIATALWLIAIIITAVVFFVIGAGCLLAGESDDLMERIP